MLQQRHKRRIIGQGRGAHPLARGDMIWGWSMRKVGCWHWLSTNSPTSLSSSRATLCGGGHSTFFSSHCNVTQHQSSLWPLHPHMACVVVEAPAWNACCLRALHAALRPVTPNYKSHLTCEASHAAEGLRAQDIEEVLHGSSQEAASPE